MSNEDVGKTTEAQDKEVEEFDKAFDEMADKEETVIPDEDNDTPADKEKPKEEKDDTKDETPVKKPDSVVQPVPDEKPSDKPGDNAPIPDDKVDWKSEADKLKAELDSVKAELEQERHRTKSWGGRISAANDRATKAEQRAAEAERKLKELQSQAKKDESLPDDDDELALKNFLKEFPDLEKPLRTLIRKEAGVRANTSNDAAKPDTTSSTVTKDASAGKSDEEYEREQAAIEHWRRIKSVHGDLFVKDKYELQDPDMFNRWISSQPPLIQRQFEGYTKQGTAEEIIEMLGLFKASMKSKQTKNKENIDRQATDLEAVPHHTGNPPKDKPVKDKDDFDSAWDEATSDEKKSKR